MEKTKNIANLNLIYFVIIGIVILLLAVFFPRQNKKQPLVNRQNCLAEDCLMVDDFEYPAGELPQPIVGALNEAINDEYKAYSTYEAVIKKFGNVRPFSMIIRAEEQHISSLKSIYDKYGLTPPQNDLSDNITAPESVQQACQIGVDAEIANATLYQEKLLPAVIDYPDITAVFKNLSDASQQKHLPAFEKCK